MCSIFCSCKVIHAVLVHECSLFSLYTSDVLQLERKKYIQDVKQGHYIKHLIIPKSQYFHIQMSTRDHNEIEINTVILGIMTLSYDSDR